MTQNNNNCCEFGFIDTERKTFHEGRVIDGEMYYKFPGVPTEIPNEKTKVKPQLVRHEGYLSGPRWKGLQKYLVQVAWKYNLKLTHREDKGWVNTTLYFEVEGEKGNVDRFKKQMEEDIEYHNSSK